MGFNSGFKGLMGGQSKYTYVNWKDGTKYNCHFCYTGIKHTHTHTHTHTRARSVCSSFSELANIIYTNCYMWEEVYIRMRSEGSAPEKWRTKAGF